MKRPQIKPNGNPGLNKSQVRGSKFQNCVCNQRKQVMPKGQTLNAENAAAREVGKRPLSSSTVSLCFFHFFLSSVKTFVGGSWDPYPVGLSNTHFPLLLRRTPLYTGWRPDWLLELIVLKQDTQIQILRIQICCATQLCVAFLGWTTPYFAPNFSFNTIRYHHLSLSRSHLFLSFFSFFTFIYFFSLLLISTILNLFIFSNYLSAFCGVPYEDIDILLSVSTSLFYDRNLHLFELSTEICSLVYF